MVFIFFLTILLIVIIAALGTGVWFLWISPQKENNKTGELESKADKLEVTESNDKTENTVSNSENKEASEAIKSALKDDQWMGEHIRTVGDIHGDNGVTFKRLEDINEMPAYLVIWNVTTDDGGEGHLAYVVSYDGKNVIVSDQPLNAIRKTVEVNVEKNYVVTKEEAEGDTEVYSIEGTEFKKIAESVYNPESDDEESSVIYYSNGKKIDSKQYEKYLSNLKEITTILNESNVDRYI